MPDAAFSGAKMLLICGDELLVYRRDSRAELPFPGKWDLPGGGREGTETPEACALRELAEEFDLHVAAERIIWSRRYPSWRKGNADSCFFAAYIERHEIDGIRFGDEGQYWQLMPVADYLESPDVIDHHRSCLRDFLSDG